MNVEIKFDERTGRCSFTQISKAECERMMNKDIREAWVLVNNIKCDYEVKLAQYFWKCCKKGMDFGRIILNFGAQCYDSVPEYERKMINKAIEYGLECNNRTLASDIVTASVGHFASRVCYGIEEGACFVEELWPYKDNLYNYMNSIYNAYSKPMRRTYF